MTEPREIEAKFDVDRQGRQRLLNVSTVGRFTVIERRSVDQDDIYFDTGDALLAAAGATLRVRRKGDEALVTFKGKRSADTSSGEAHIASRLEDEVPLSASDSALVTTDAPLPAFANISPLDRARAIVGGGDLLPVAQLRNSRVTLLLSDGESTLELAVDDCVGTRLQDGRDTRFDEVELESKSADRATLIEVGDALRALVPGLRPSRLTKLGRTLGQQR
jgi:inorganic triphosphatase YgiF